jgi:hypothetical protein
MIALDWTTTSSARGRTAEKTMRVAERLRHLEMVVSLADYKLHRFARGFDRRDSQMIHQRTSVR